MKFRTLLLSTTVALLLANLAWSAPMISGQAIDDNSFNSTLDTDWMHFQNPGTVGISSLKITLPAGFDFGESNSPDFFIGGGNTATYNPAGGPSGFDMATMLTVDFSSFAPGEEAHFGVDVDTVGNNDGVQVEDLVAAGVGVMATFANGSTFNGQFAPTGTPPPGTVGVLEGSIQPVPEPASIASWSLLGLMAVGYGWRRKRRSRDNAAAA